MSHDSLISMGMLGWTRKSPDEPHYDNGTKDNDGNTLFHVQLFAGADPDILTPEQLKDGEARGYRVVCQMSSHIRRIPPAGTKVLVAFPNGYQQSAGSGVIIATLEPNPTAVSDKAVSVTEERVSIDYGEKDIVISGRSVTIRSYANEFVSVGDAHGAAAGRGVTIQTVNGSGMNIQDDQVGMFLAADGAGVAMMRMNGDGIQIMTKAGAGSFITLDTNGFRALGSKCILSGGHVYLGTAPTAATPAAYGPVPGSGSLISTSVFISPV